jgi:hypothetical protein
MDGQIEGYRIYNGTLTDSQISIEYDNQSTAGSWWIAADATLIEQGFSLLGDIKAPTITGTATNVPMLVKPNTEFTVAMKAALDVSGGDLRFTSDIAGLVQLPIEIVDGLNVVWTLVPSVASNQLVYVWGDNTGVSQPAVGDPFGRNAVWVDLEDVRHGGDLIDSSGNNANLTTVSTATTNNTGFNGQGAFDGNNTSGFHAVGASHSGSYIFRQWINFNSFVTTGDSSQRAIGLYDGTDGAVISLTQADKLALYTFGGNDAAGQAAATALSTATWYHAVCVFDTSAQTVTHYLNGAQDRQTASFTDTSPTTNPDIAYGISAASLTTDGVDAKQQWCSVEYGSVTPDQISIEYDNQSEPNAWWIASDVGGGGGGDPINKLQYGASTVSDVKYYNGSVLVDIELSVNGTIVWRI